MTGSSDEDIITDQLYDAALSPERIEALMQSWTSLLSNAATKARAPDPRLARDLQRASEILAFSDEAWAREQAAASALKNDTQPVMTISSDGQIQDMNAAAQNAYGLTPGTDIHALPFDEGSVEAIERFVRAKSPAPVTHVARIDDDRTTLVFLSAPADDEFVLRTTDTAWSNELGRILKAAFSLTAAELAVAKHLIEGDTTNAIVEKRGSSIATVRTQMRSIFFKTETRSQTEFLRMALGAKPHSSLQNDDTPHAAAGQSGRFAANQHPLKHECATHLLRDGRIIEYARFGAENGTPILYIHDVFFGPYWPSDAVERAKRAGLSIIVPFRPFCGRSDGTPSGNGSIEFVCEDIIELMQALKVNPSVILSRTLGLAYAVTIARLNPGSIQRIIAAPPALPVINSEDVDTMPRWHRLQFLLLSKAPHLIDYIGHLGISYLKRVGVKRPYLNAYKSSKADHEALRDQSLLDAIDAWVRANHTTLQRAWTSELHRQVPFAHGNSYQAEPSIDVFIGADEDNSREARARALKKAGAPLNIEIVEDAGELLFYSHTDRILDAVIAAVER